MNSRASLPDPVPAASAPASRDRGVGHVAISITEGRTVRDLLYNGFLDLLTDSGLSVTLFTEAWRVPAFAAEWARPGLVDLAPLYPCEHTSRHNRGYYMRRRLIRHTGRLALRPWLALERRLFQPHPDYIERFRRHRPDLLLTTHAHLYREAELLASARSEGVPELGIVRSWDNVYKGIRSRPERLTVWNQINRREVIDLEGYRDSEVEVIGAPQFDAYFDPNGVWSRERLAREFELDPARPILLFGSFGNFFPDLDETVWMAEILQLIDQGRLPRNAQVICRLHPWSKLEQFQRFAQHPAVRLSYVDRYWPGLTWYMTREDVILVGNMLRHADVVITPGSTLTLEAAIFDRPTVVPIFHPMQPERAQSYFSTWMLGKHFGRIQELDLAPIATDRTEFETMIRQGLEQPSSYSAKRRRLVEDYVHFTDGQSTKRLADLVLQRVRACT